MNQNVCLKQNVELRAIARQNLKGKWLYAVLVCLIAEIISVLLCWIPFISFIYSLIITGPIAFGLATFFLNLRRAENPLIENLFDGFKSFSPALVLELWIVLFTFLWTLLFIIPGIIAAFRYALSFYILHDHPGMEPREVIQLSKQMMMGRKGKLFMLYLSFIGWGLLCVCTFGIGLLWLIPYINAAVANFYEDVKDAPLADGVSTVTTTG